MTWYLDGMKRRQAPQARVEMTDRVILIFRGKLSRVLCGPSPIVMRHGRG